MARPSRRQVRGAGKALAAGFTMIELLASMVILVMIVLLMTRMMNEANNVWTLGTQRVTTASDGRAVMDLLATELSQALGDSNLTFRTENTTPRYGTSASYVNGSDEIYFAAAVEPGDNDYKRNVHQFAYFVAPMLDLNNTPIPNRYRLARTRRTKSVYENWSNAAYKDLGWWSNMNHDNYQEDGILPCETVAENVTFFQVDAWSSQAGGYVTDYNSQNEGNRLPLWVDIYLEVLGESDAVKVSALWAVNQAAAEDLLLRSVRRFTTRVEFPNRERAGL